MACPSCGATSYRPIALGYVECTGSREVMVPDIYGGHQPQWHSCGHRYHLADRRSDHVSGACACGLFSIGQCTECGTHFCGDHSAVRADHRLCLTHAADFDSALRLQREAASEAEALKRVRVDAERRQVRQQRIAELSTGAQFAAGQAISALPAHVWSSQGYPASMLALGGAMRPAAKWRSRLKKHLRIDFRHEEQVNLRGGGADRRPVASILVGEHGDVAHIVRTDGYAKWKLADSWAPEYPLPDFVRAVLVSGADQIERPGGLSWGVVRVVLP